MVTPVTSLVEMPVTPQPKPLAMVTPTPLVEMPVTPQPKPLAVVTRTPLVGTPVTPPYFRLRVLFLKIPSRAKRQ